MKRVTLDLWVGIFVLVGICATLFLALQVAARSNLGLGSGGDYTLYAKFSNIGSLKVDAPVKVSGFLVGKVSNIFLDPKTYQAVVKMQIDNQYKFTEDTSAQILTTGLLGEQYIGLQAGSSESFLSNNGYIQITSSALVLENLIGKFMTNITSK